ncbi:unnamed protein product, partial [Brenthis ino]
MSLKFLTPIPKQLKRVTIPCEGKIKVASPSETLQIECDDAQTWNAKYHSKIMEESVVTNSLTPVIQNHKIEVLDVLVLPKWQPNSKIQCKRIVPKAQCLTPVVATSSLDPSTHVKIE